MTGLDAEHGEELHLLPGDPLASLGAPALKLLRDMQPGGFVGSAAVVGVNLREDNGVAALRGQVRARPPVYPPLDPTWPAAGAARGTWAFFGGFNLLWGHHGRCHERPKSPNTCLEQVLQNCFRPVGANILSLKHPEHSRVATSPHTQHSLGPAEGKRGERRQLPSAEFSPCKIEALRGWESLHDPTSAPAHGPKSPAPSPGDSHHCLTYCRAAGR